MTMSVSRLCAAFLVLALCACAGTAPKAWERGHLAQPEMAWDPDPATASQREHTYASKEAASGGATIGGGGCGCN